MATEADEVTLPPEVEESVSYEVRTGEEEAEPEAKAEEAGPARDSKGRFTSPAGEEADAEEAPATSPEGVVEGTEPAAEVEEDYEAFSYMGDGRSHTIPGSMVGEHGIFVPKDYLPQLKQDLAAAVHHRGAWQGELEKIKTEAAELRAQAEADMAESQYLREEFEKLATGDPQAFEDFMVEYRTNMGRWKSEARAAKVEAENVQLRSRFDAREETDRTAVTQREMAEGLDVLVEQGVIAYPGLDATLMRQRLDRMKSSIFTTLKEDDPISGHKKGTVVWDEQFVADVFHDYGSRVENNVSTQSETGKTNQAAVTPQKNEAPPVVPVQGTTTGTTALPPKFKTQEEMDEWMESGAGAKWGMSQLRATE